MAKFTKKQFHALNEIRAKLVRVEQYLKQENVAVCRKDGFASTTLHYTRADGSTMYEVDKEIGSDLCMLSTAIASLTDMLMARMSDSY